MGRELKRVPLDFDWPQGTIWKGYLNPHRPTDCKECDGTGLNKETKQIEDDWYDFDDTGRKWCHAITDDEVLELILHGRLMDFTHVPLDDKQKEDVRKKVAKGGNSWLPYNNGYIPSAEEVNKWSKEGMGHDAINRGICVETRARRLGVYGECRLCGGRGHYWCEDKYEKLYQDWAGIEPPRGSGYQLWETTSEGSPKSPVFKTLDELCRWCAEFATTFGASRASAGEWKKMLDDGFVYHKDGNRIFT